MATTKPIPDSDAAIEQRALEIRRGLRKLNRSYWTLWFLAILIMLALTVAVVTLAMTANASPADASYHFGLSQAVRGLVGVVLLFSVYTLHQQIQLMRTRRSLAEQVEISTEKHLLAEQYLKLAMLDPLTGLHNRRYAQERLATEMARAQRGKTSLTVLAMDIDDLKAINDRHGHAAGDLALKAFGERLSKAIRGSDLAVRIGGDEFVVLLPECGLEQVQIVIERLEGLRVRFDSGTAALQFSAGWTNYQAGETAEQFLERADQALYNQKQSRKKPVAVEVSDARLK